MSARDQRAAACVQKHLPSERESIVWRQKLLKLAHARIDFHQRRLQRAQAQIANANQRQEILEKAHARIDFHQRCLQRALARLARLQPEPAPEV